MKPNNLPNSFASNTTDKKTPNNNESIFADTKKVKVFLYYTETKDIHNVEILGNRLYQYDFIDGKLVNPNCY
jgi:hypothetical protein